MRIAYLHYMSAPGSQKGGPGVHIAESVGALRALGHTVEVIGPTIDVGTAPAAGGTVRRSVLRRALGRYGYEPRAILRSLWRAREPRAALTAFAPDVIVARYEAFELAPLLLARACGVPLVWEVNGTSREIGWWNPEVFVYPGTIAFERATLHAGDAIFVVSDELRAELARDGVEARRVAVIPNGADPTRFGPDKRRPGLVPVDDVTPVVGFLGSFSRWHDVETMAAAVVRVATAAPQVRFVLAGTAWDDMPAAVRTILTPVRDRLVCPGVIPIADAPAWMARFDVALSLYPQIDPFYFSPVKLFEYLASGVAVVATRIGQQTRLIRDGESGLLVAPGDVEGVTQAIRALVNDPARRARLGAAARAGIVEGYTWRHNGARIVALCEAVRAARAAGRPLAAVPAAAERP